MTPLSAAPAAELQAPGLGRRMACFIYEGMMLFGIGLIPGAIGALFVALSGQQRPPHGETILQLAAFVIYGLYFTWFWSRHGQTLPMQTWHMRVVTEQGRPLSTTRALLRYFAACLWFAPAALVATLNHWTGWEALAATGVGVAAYALLALLHPQRQFWHDALCGTRLVDAQPVRRTA